MSLFFVYRLFVLEIKLQIDAIVADSTHTLYLSLY